MAIWSFTKAKRAQSVDDDETWIEGGVVPTLNAFDLGDTRTTVIIIDGTRVGDVRVYEDDVMQTVIQRWGTGGGNVPYVYPIQGTVIGRSDTAGPQGKGFGEDGDPMYTIDTVGGHGVAVYPIQDGREVEKKQNGIGVADDGSPAYTVDTLATQAVAVSQLNDSVVGPLTATGMSRARGTETVESHHYALTASYDEYNDKLGGDIHHSLCAGTQQSTGVLVAPTLSASNNPSRSPQSAEVTAQVAAMVEATSIVRRLTPIECERLQGFPDDWTAQRFDYKKQQIVEQADSNRYKQMGNAVAVPVVDWIINRLVAIDADDNNVI